jgi:hypothetical protein
MTLITLHSKITENRKFCAVIIDVRCRKLLYTEFEVVFKVKDCKSKCLLNLSVHLNNSTISQYHLNVLLNQVRSEISRILSF